MTRQTRPDGREILFGYDAAGNLTSLTPPGRPAHTFSYTPVGLLEQYNPPGIPGAKPTRYFYNLDRQLDSLVRPDSITVALAYDSAGRPQAVTFDRGTLTMGYSPTTGNLTGIRTPDGDSLTFAYDGSLPKQVRWVGTVAGTVGVTYDHDFRVTAQTVNGANAVSFTYDGDGLLTSAGALALGRDPANGLLLADTLGPVRSAYRYTSRGELEGYRVTHGSTPLFATGYVRDSLGRIVQLFDTTQGTPTRWSFVYDSVGRLVEDSVNGAVFHAFTYDDNGNRLSFTSGAGTVNYSYDDQDRLLAAGTTTFTYGSNGELKTKTVPGMGTTSYTYDALGNLTRVVVPSDTVIEYLIDGQNRRVGRKVNGVLVQAWLYQNRLSPVAELDGGGNVVSRFVYGSRPTAPDYVIKSGVTYRLITDHLGSVRLVVDTATGTVVQRLDYDEWGQVSQNTNPGFQPFGFGAGLLDPSTGLVRFGARDYDASAGRWTTKDPIEFAGRHPNLYVYVANDPINRVDPSGLFWWDLVDVAFFFKSLYNFLDCPSWGTFGDLALDGVGLLPLIPSVGLLDEVGDAIRLLENSRESLLRTASDARLKDVINQLYRRGAKVGDGSAMDAFRHELKTGELLSRSGHGPKLVERRTQLVSLLHDRSLSASDRRLVRDLLINIQNALGGR